MPPPIGSTRAGAPTKLRALKGSLNESRENQRRRGGKEPRRVPGVPNAPPYLSQLESDAWTRFADVLGEQGMKVVSREEFAAFEALVVSYAKFQRLSAAMRDVKDREIVCVKTIFNKQGMEVGEELKIHPAFAAVQAAEAALMNWLGRFGLTPGDAGRVAEAGTAGGGGDESPMTEF